jgi:endonuclease/exonuclease/phosphatase family metal-dependent hydrolase
MHVTFTGANVSIDRTMEYQGAYGIMLQPRIHSLRRRLNPWLAQLKRRSASITGGDEARPNTSKLTIASYNIHKCVGNDGVFDPIRIKNVILQLDADIVVLQEADARFGEREGLLDLDYLHVMGGYRSIFSPDRNSRSHGWHGNVVLYRNSIVNHVHQLRLPGLEPRGALIVDFGIGEASFRLLAVHLGLLRRSRKMQVEAIIEAADPHPLRHVVVIGDMNEWRLERRSALELFKSHFEEISARLPSYPSRYPVLPLDRLFVSRGLRVESLSVVDTPLTRIASDHLPVNATISIESSLVS